MKIIIFGILALELTQTKIYDVLYLPDQLKSLIMNNDINHIVPLDIEYKHINPGEQTTSTFHSIVMDDINVFFESSFYDI